MLVQKIDPVRPQAPERRLNMSPDVLRAAIPFHCRDDFLSPSAYSRISCNPLLMPV
jgi:hypothetical protein